MSRFHIYETRIKFLEMKRELFSSFPILHFQFRFAYNFPLSMQCNYACNAVCNRPRYLVESKLITVTRISPVFYFTNIPLVTPPVRLLFIALTILEVFLLTEDRDVNENVPFEISSARGNAWPESENEPRYNDKCKLDDSPETDFKVTRPLEWGMIIVFIFLSFFFFNARTRLCRSYDSSTTKFESFGLLVFDSESSLPRLSHPCVRDLIVDFKFPREERGLKRRTEFHENWESSVKQPEKFPDSSIQFKTHYSDVKGFPRLTKEQVAGNETS